MSRLSVIAEPGNSLRFLMYLITIKMKKQLYRQSFTGSFFQERLLLYLRLISEVRSLCVFISSEILSVNKCEEKHKTLTLKTYLK